MTLAGALRLLATMGLWASCFPLIAIGLNLAPHLAFAAMRAALGGAGLLALGILFRRPMPRGARSWMLIGVTGISATSLGFLGMFHAAEFVSPGIASVIFNTQPLVGAVLARAFLNEKLAVTGKIGLVVGFAGIVIMSSPGLASADAQGYATGIVYIALAAIGTAVGNLAMKRLSGDVDAMMAVGFSLLLGAVPLALWSALKEDMSLPWTGEFAVVLAVLSVFGTSLAFWLWFTALQNVELGVANAFTFLGPLFGLAIGAAAFGERIGWLQAVGVILVLAGVVIAQLRNRTDAEAKVGSVDRTHFEQNRG